MMNVTQLKFITTWNKTSAILKESDDPALNDLPIFEGGICAGLCFLLAEYVHLENEARFFQLYHHICLTPPEDLVKELQSNIALQNEMINFIQKIYILQNKKFEQVAEGVENDLNNHGDLSELDLEQRIKGATEPNHTRIGNSAPQYYFYQPDKRTSRCYMRVYGNLVNNNDACIANIHAKSFAHSVLFYKTNNRSYAFDPNDGYKKEMTLNMGNEAIYYLNDTITQKTKSRSFFSKYFSEKTPANYLYLTLLLPLVPFLLIYDCFFSGLTKQEMSEKPFVKNSVVAFGYFSKQTGTAPPLFNSSSIKSYSKNNKPYDHNHRIR